EQFDVIDLTDNDIRKLNNLPQLKRLESLILNNNRVQLMVNPLRHKQHYRAYIIHKLKSVGVLDFRRIKDKGLRRRP
ncbi:U2 small nuclear ribonucleoprotein A, partial [Aphelenchoides avenae]